MCVVVGRARSRLRLSTSVGRRVLHGCPVAVALPCRDLKPRAGIDDIVLGSIFIPSTAPSHRHTSASAAVRAWVPSTPGPSGL